ncbi:DNA topoisomerase 3-beta [Diplonema papillatum]|nr:DNA topoisomerase 3-beta [Diplonema papillatum]
MRTVLMVAEKPSLADAISKLLSDGRAIKHSRTSRACPVFEYSGRFRGEEARFKFTCTVGHVFSIEFASQYNNWQTVDEERLFFEAKLLKNEASATARVVAHLKQEAKGCTDIVLWLDCDREGENICFEVLDCVKDSIRGWDRIWRAKFSAITKTELVHAMNNLIKPDENQSKAVDARQELDLKVGVAFTRFQTKYFQSKYGNLDASVVSYGPCQTPTLGFVVQRHDLIHNFKPETFWRICPTVVKSGVSIRPDWERNRLFDRGVARLILEGCKGKAKVTKVETKRDAKSRPGALNTVEMLKIASKVLGVSPHAAMHTAERLYTSGFISYPRTESTMYPPSFDLMAPLRDQQNNPRWGAHVKELLAAGITRPKSGVDMGDHPPITPMRPATEGMLGGDEWRLYDYITRHFIATVSPDMHYTRTKVLFAIGTETFTAVGRSMDKGRMSFADVLFYAKVDDEILPDGFYQGEQLDVKTLELYEGETSPPGYLTEADLIGKMEKSGIGTDASIPTHINTICERGYASVGQGRTMIPNPLGIILVHGLHKIDPELVLPLVRQNVEREGTKIAEGHADKEAVVEWTLRIFFAKFRFFKDNIVRMDQLMEASFSPLASTGQNISRCKCLRYLKYIDTRPQRLYCPKCEETLSLPQNGTIRPYLGKKCPLDNYEIVMFLVQDGKSYPLCPQCYSDPPFEDHNGHQMRTMGCNECPHPTCELSAVQNTVTACPDEKCSGYLQLDASTAPKWKLVCNTSWCPVIVKLPKAVIKAEVNTKKTCPECNSNTLRVTFAKDKSPIEGALTHQGCVNCDEYLSSALTEVRGRMGNPRPRTSKGGKKGKKGGGKGGKGGKRGPKDEKMGFDTF